MKKLSLILAICLLFGTVGAVEHEFGGQLQKAKETLEITPNGDMWVWAFYYHHMTDWGRERGEPRHDKALWRQHISMAKDAGIDGFLVSHFDENDREVYSQLVELGRRMNFQINPYVEVWSMMNSPGGGKILWDELQWLAETHRPRMYVLFVSIVIPNSTWKAIIDRTDPSALWICGNPHDPHFDGLEWADGCHIYNPAKTPIGEWDKWYHRIGESVRFLEPDMGWDKKLWCATVMPGFDESSMSYRVNPLIVDRDGGRYLRQSFDAAIASDPDMIFITSFNEIPETSYIVPGYEFDDLYLEITREYIELWKGGE